MANFFKDYHANIRAKRESETRAEVERVEYCRGDAVRINPIYDENRNGKRYFADYLENGFVILAKTKKDALNGFGHIYHESIIL